MSDIEERCDIFPVWDMKDADWLELRSGGIGGSDLGALLGVNKYSSALELWGEKTGKVPREFVDNAATRLGKRFEAPLAEELAEQENIAIVEWPVSLRLKSHPWMLANIDRLIVEPCDEFPAGKVTIWRSAQPPKGIIALLELKTTGLASTGTGHHWGSDEAPSFPVTYGYQAMHYGLVSGITDLWLVGLLGGKGIKIRRIPWDEDEADYIMGMESAFWNNNVLAGVPPQPDGSESAEETLKELFPKAETDKDVEGGSTLGLLWNDLESAKAEFNVAEARKKELRAKILMIIGDGEYGMVHGQRILSFKNSKDGEKFDEKKFAAENPKVYAKYLSVKPGHRTLLPVRS